jgi:hypothetical protein
MLVRIKDWGPPPWSIAPPVPGEVGSQDASRRPCGRPWCQGLNRISGLAARPLTYMLYLGNRMLLRLLVLAIGRCFRHAMISMTLG